MRNLLLVMLFTVLAAAAYAQSPYYSFIFKLEEIMYHGNTCQSEYKIKLVRYENLNTNITTNPYGHDTSGYDWGSFRERADNDFRKSVIGEQTDKSYVLNFKAANQGYIFNNYYEIIITRYKCGFTETMTMYFPIRISSFVTFVNLGVVYFIPGDFNLNPDIIYSISEDSELSLNLPKDYWIKK
jgi:hypothetical protein